MDEIDKDRSIFHRDGDPVPEGDEVRPKGAKGAELRETLERLRAAESEAGSRADKIRSALEPIQVFELELGGMRIGFTLRPVDVYSMALGLRAMAESEE